MKTMIFLVSYIQHIEDKNYTYCDGGYWHICRYVDNPVTHETAEGARVLCRAEVIDLAHHLVKVGIISRLQR